MGILPRTNMTRRTVAAQCKGLGIGAVSRHQVAVAIMTVGAVAMRARCNAQQRIIMTAGTVASRLDQ